MRHLLPLLLALAACSESAYRKSAGGDDPVPADGDATGDSGAEDTAAPDTGDTASPDTGADTSCQPVTCAELGATCGTVDDGCGATLTCGTCDAWSACEANVCVASACHPTEQDSTDGGGRCDDLDQAWTGRGINVGYYPFEVVAPIEQYSGDYDGPAGEVFTPGSRPGVILQVVPVGSYVALSSTGPWYNPTGECFPEGTCGSESETACDEDSPPLRPGVSGFYWGYAYQGASHMQGWFQMDAAKLRWVGHDASHPCATGPAGADFEVPEACGVATVCSGTNRTCGDANPCTEGSDDCGACSAESGGPLTPTAHRKTVTYPAEADECATRTPPHESVECLDNGSDEDFFFVYPHGAYLYWAQNSTTKHWLHYGDQVQSYYHTRDAQGVLWDFVEVLSTGAPVLTPASDGTGAGGTCSSSNPSGCNPCQNGGTCGWIQAVFLD